MGLSIWNTPVAQGCCPCNFQTARVDPFKKDVFLESKGQELLIDTPLGQRRSGEWGPGGE
eukprot:scaffold71558_cov23-Tisochrysis_lutea.AAC.1